MSERIDSFRDLKVCGLANEMQWDVFRASRSFPKEERYSLTDQIRRSSRSVGASIAEAWQKRRYPAHFVSKLTDAEGEIAETEHWIDTAHQCGCLDASQVAELLASCRSIGRMIGAMMKSPAKWCGSASTG